LAAHLLSSRSDVEVLGMGRSEKLAATFTHSIYKGSQSVPAPLPADLRQTLDDCRYRYVSADIRQREHLTRLLRDFQPQYVFHLASGLRGDRADKLFRVNVEGTIQLVEAIAEAELELEMLVVGSTGGVYGNPSDGDLPLVETARCLPVDLYSTSKLAAEQASKILCERYGIPIAWARLFNLLGPGQDERHVCGRLASQADAILGGTAPPVIDIGTLVTTRDFIDVRDVATALEAIAARAAPGTCVNVGSGIETSIRTVLEMVLQVAGLQHSAQIRSRRGRRAEIPRHVADVQRLKALAFRCEWSLEHSIRDLLNYYCRSQPIQEGARANAA
jgi:GDP-4-dehydro-6-deoxy-D-mannose reductase